MLAVRPREERFNGGRWHPVGTLAAEVLNRLPVPHPALAQALTDGRSSATPSAIRHALSRVLRVRTARAVSPIRFRASVQNMDWAWLEQVAANVRALARGAEDELILDPPLSMVARWNGPYGDSDLFRTTPGGAVLLSGVYGVIRGRLRVCRGCEAFVSFPRGRWIGRYCNGCWALRNGRPQGGESPKLAAWKQARWAKVRDRMRKRGFARLARTREGPVTDAERDQWTRSALNALHHVATRQALEKWEQDVAPRGAPGRPKKQAGHPSGR